MSQFTVFHDFQFTDRVNESGITFVHHVVEDAGKHYKAVHYDHGNGIAVADVDGDGLYDIYFVNQVGGNELWKNLGGGRFRNITKEAGVGLADRIGVAASFADIDNDGDQDLFVTTVRGGNVLFENDGHGHFRDISKEAGVDLVAHSSGAVFFDFDHDGLVDLLVCNVGQYTTDRERTGRRLRRAGRCLPRPHAPGPLRVSRALPEHWDSNHFKDVTADVGLRPTGWSGDASVADLNGDGLPDLFVLNMQGHGHYFENQGGTRSSTRPRSTSRGRPGARWGSSSSTSTTTAGRISSSPTCTRTCSRPCRPTARRQKAARASARAAPAAAPPTRSSSATPSSTTSRAAEPRSRRSPTGPASRTTGRGVRASAM